MLAGVAAGQVSHTLKIGTSDKLEVYDYPGAYAKRFDGVSPGGGDRDVELQKIFEDNKRTVQLRMQEQAAGALVIQGGGNHRGFASGNQFTLERHHHADGAYLLTSVQHTARLDQDYRSGAGKGFRYSNSFTCIPAALPFRPARKTPRPVIHGTQTAVVVGPPGEEIFPDKYGRVKVQFHWDRRGRNDPSSSCWVRVASPWAGRNWGMIHIPRVGQEVVVAFEEGDPDRPIITGSVYNADHMPPYKLPAEKTKSTLKSRSSPKGRPKNSNEIRFEDKTGREQVFINAERDLDLRVGRETREFVGKNRHLIVRASQLELVRRNKHGRVAGNHREKIGGDMSLRVGGKKSETVGTVLASEAGQEVHIKAGMKVVLEAGSEISLSCPGGFVTIGPGGVTIQGAKVQINSGGQPGTGSGTSPVSPKKPDTADDGSKSGRLNRRKKPKPKRPCPISDGGKKPGRGSPPDGKKPGRGSPPDGKKPGRGSTPDGKKPGRGSTDHRTVKAGLMRGFRAAGRPDLARMVGTKDFETWIQQESGWKPGAVSPANNQGKRNDGLFQIWRGHDFNAQGEVSRMSPLEQAKAVARHFPQLTPARIRHYADQIRAGTYKGWG
jgi:phage baseplate assembly protein gpV